MSVVTEKRVYELSVGCRNVELSRDGSRIALKLDDGYGDFTEGDDHEWSAEEAREVAAVLLKLADLADPPKAKTTKKKGG